MATLSPVAECRRFHAGLRNQERNYTMKKKPSSNPLLDPEAAKELTDSEWAALHVLRFKQQRRRYEIYTHFLEKVLKAACQKLAPLCIISTRPKSLTSFAEKILRKRPLYMDPKFPYPRSEEHTSELQSLRHLVCR